MRMTTPLQREQNKTPPPLEPIRRLLKPPITPRSSPQEPPSTPEPSNSQLDHLMGIPASPLQIPRGSGSQTSWEQVFPHPIPTRQAVFPYIVCLPLQGGDVQEEESSSHKAPRQPLFPLYPLSQRFPFGVPRAICSATPLGEEPLKPHTPTHLRDYLMPAPAEGALVATHQTLQGAIRRTLLEVTRRTPPEATRQALPGAIRRAPLEATRQIHPEVIHPRGHQAAALLRDHPVGTHPKDHPGEAHLRAHPEATHLRAHPEAIHHRVHPVATHLKAHQAAAHPRDHQEVHHPKGHPEAALPRVPREASPTPGGKAPLGHPARQAHREPPECNQPSLLLSQSITHSLSRHRPRPGSRLPNQRTSRENPRRPRNS